MVAKMRSPEFAVSAKADSDLASNLELPVFEEPLIEHWPSPISWSHAMRVFAPYRDYYMRRFDSPEKRLRARNPEPFSLC